MDSGKWIIDSGKWIIDNGEWIVKPLKGHGDI
jgi:hypothetical protein